MNNIILIGFMAVGKSTIGRSLKEILKFPQFDIDKMIEKEEKMNIPSIFKNKGETYFREKELEIGMRLLARNNNIISTGGGLFMNAEFREKALKNNFVVFLDLDIEEVYKRVNRNDRRPLAKGRSIEDLRALYNERLPFYMMADARIKTDRKTPNRIADEITDYYYKWLDREI